MNVFLVHVGDDDFSRVLPKALDKSPSDSKRVKIMAFPPLGIQTLAPVLRQHGHSVRMFDTCHPEMKAEHLAEAVEPRTARRDWALLPLDHHLPGGQEYGRAAEVGGARHPHYRWRPVCHDERGPHPEGLPAHRLRGRGRGRGVAAGLPVPTCTTRVPWPAWSGATVTRIVQNAPRPLLRDLDRFPYPDRSSLPIDYIESLPLDVPAVLSLDKFCTVQTSRGCPYSCIYCDIPSLSEGKWRCRSPNTSWEKCRS